MSMQQSLELIKTRTIFLNEGQLSEEVVLVDEIGGDMYFTFFLRYIPEGVAGRTHFEVIDNFHAKITVETKPSSFTQFTNPFQIGIYQKLPLYLNVTVEPSFNAEERSHRVTISFYVEKEKDAEHGTEQE